MLCSCRIVTLDITATCWTCHRWHRHKLSWVDRVLHVLGKCISSKSMIKKFLHLGDDFGSFWKIMDNILHARLQLLLVFYFIICKIIFIIHKLFLSSNIRKVNTVVPLMYVLTVISVNPDENIPSTVAFHCVRWSFVEYERITTFLSMVWTVELAVV